MSMLAHLGREDLNERELYFVSAPNLTSLPESFALPSKHFVAFLAMDASLVETSGIAKLAGNLIQSGCVYFCAWGIDCERVHDIFDESCYEIDPVIMTTWHEKDSLDEALWFFLASTWPDDGYFDNCQSSLAIVIGNSDLGTEVQQKLSNRQSLKDAVLREE